jgi:lysophospholipase L1-like esterase
MKFRLVICLLLLTSSLATAEPKTTRSREKGLFEFRDGDRVVFVGSGFIERLQNTGYLETMLTAAMPSKNITFRNLGWSGDTVWGDARAVFGSRADGFKRLLSDVALCKPTVLIVCYGENEAYAGEAGLEEFRSGLSTLLDSLEATGARIVLLGPRKHEKMPPPLPDPVKYNVDLRMYNAVIGTAAKEREHTFIDLYDLGKDQDSDERNSKLNADLYQLTQDGIHLSDYGNERIAEPLAALLGIHYQERTFRVDAKTGAYDVVGATILNSEISTKGLEIEALDRSVPFISSEPTNKNSEPSSSSGLFQVDGLAEGEYQIKVDGKLVGTQEWFKLAYTWYVDHQSESQFDSLRQAINDKNTLFFHRYRPQNETYLFLFRKHEQGNNAVEIPQFDPLISELEKKIAELKKPVKQKYELIKVK